MIQTVSLRGMALHSGFLDASAQAAILADLRAIVAQAPLFTPRTRRGPMSVQMTSAGSFGWVSDGRGYRYEPRHPNGTPWPEIPASIRAIWDSLVPMARAPECCLVNLYRGSARMGMHQDHDEADLTQPVVSVSLGDDALFRVGNDTRGGRTESHWLRSGDVVVMGGEARLLFHGIDRLREGSSTLLEGGGRINLTLRVVT